MRRWLLLMDLDRTMWSHHDISSLKPPFKRAGPGIVVDAEGVEIRLNQDMVRLVEWALGRGAITSTLSWNRLERAVEVLRAFGIDRLFHYITAEDTPRKDLMLEKLLQTLRRQGIEIPPARIIYIDDRDIHIGEIRRRIGDINFLMYGRDIRNFEEAVEKISNILGDG